MSESTPNKALNLRSIKIFALLSFFSIDTFEKYSKVVASPARVDCLSFVNRICNHR